MIRNLFKAAPPDPFDLNPRTDTPLDFPFHDYGHLTPDDYDRLGFICGLEVHQQLATRSKLFCRCPAGRSTARVDGEVLRHMRPTLSELGQYDGCALMEFKTRKDIVYLLERSTVCTYEMDDTPPFEIDEEAVRVALHVSRLFGLSLVSELQVMRKQYLDGSIPAGFQRSAMIAVGGEIPFRESELGRDQVIRIRQLTLEEDSCREVSDVGHLITFRTDRLGTPLVETVTEPDLLTPLDVAAGGRLLSRVVHTSGAVRRGPGAARQDVNVSIAGGRRVEIKGVAHHRGLPRLVHIEAFRQLELLKLRAELLDRGVTKDQLTIPEVGVAWESSLAVDARRALRGCGYPPVADALARGDFIAAVRLPRFDDLLGRRLQPGMTFAHEFADRVRVIACLTARPFMISSHLQDYGLKASTWRRVRAALSAESRDAMLVVWGAAADVDTAVREILIRAQDALDGVPSETRQSYGDLTTGLERILPGPQRMYPDTDTPPLPVPETWIVAADEAVGELPWDREDRYVATGLSRSVAARLVDAPWADLFDALSPTGPESAGALAHAFETRLPHHRRTLGAELPSADRLRPLVAAVEAESVHPQAFATALDDLMRDAGVAPDEVVNRYAARGDVDRAELERRLSEIEWVRTERAPNLPRDAAHRLAMGLVMPALLGRLPAQVVGSAVDAWLGDAPELAA